MTAPSVNGSAGIFAVTLYDAAAECTVHPIISTPATRSMSIEIGCNTRRLWSGRSDLMWRRSAARCVTFDARRFTGRRALAGVKRREWLLCGRVCFTLLRLSFAAIIPYGKDGYKVKASLCGYKEASGTFETGGWLCRFWHFVAGIAGQNFFDHVGYFFRLVLALDQILHRTL